MSLVIDWLLIVHVFNDNLRISIFFYFGSRICWNSNTSYIPYLFTPGWKILKRHLGSIILVHWCISCEARLDQGPLTKTIEIRNSRHKLPSWNQMWALSIDWTYLDLGVPQTLETLLAWYAASSRAKERQSYLFWLSPQRKFQGTTEAIRRDFFLRLSASKKLNETKVE